MNYSKYRVLVTSMDVLHDMAKRIYSNKMKENKNLKEKNKSIVLI